MMPFKISERRILPVDGGADTIDQHDVEAKEEEDHSRLQHKHHHHHHHHHHQHKHKHKHKHEHHEHEHEHDEHHHQHTHVKRKSTAQNSGSTTQRREPFSIARWNWILVLVNLATYALFMTDVPRSGIHNDLRQFKRVGQGEWMYFGPYAYVVSYFHTFEAADGSTGVIASTDIDGRNQAATARTWSYKYDTTSIGLRTLATELPKPLKQTTASLMYEDVRLPPTSTMRPRDTFAFLESIMDVVALRASTDMPQIYANGSSTPERQRVRYNGVTKSRRTDLLYDMITHRFVEMAEYRAIRATHFAALESDPAIDVCAFPRDRPFVCDLGIMANYKATAKPTDPVGKRVGRVEQDINRQLQALVFRAVATHNYTNITLGQLTVDAVLLDSIAQPLTFSGGMVMAAKGSSEFVLLTRVRDCTAAGSCRTLVLGDYRYEAGQFISDVEGWNTLVSLLRAIGQSYAIARIFALVIAVHVAFPPERRNLALTARIVLAEAPSHVVTYGSALPIVFYAVAHMIDASMTNMLLVARLIKIQGSVVTDPWELLQIVSLSMRNQWLIAAVAWLAVHIQTSLNGAWRREYGVVSIRGHVCGLLSSMSVVFGYRHVNFRDTRVLSAFEENPNTAVMLATSYMREPAKQRNSGVFGDVITITICAIVYVVCVIVVKSVVRAIKATHKGFARGAPYALPGEASTRTLRSLQVERAGILVSETKHLPSSCGVFWSPAGLSCAWGGDMLAGPHGSNMTVLERSMLMNIVFLSEPFTYLSLRFGFSSGALQFIRHRRTGRKLACAVRIDVDDDEVRQVPTIDELNEDSEYDVVETVPAVSVPFHVLVQCR
ncbi:hypothetical protein PINS_up002198 [Pythium insidiosum]|nr:hypothetical protein PINS_up002198 [Pythium insidiosum]